jgi:ubiquinone/menaquinone biosynthesis C-methylase UbiE
MTADFDTSAEVYDEAFTDSNIGRGQRRRVWAYLRQQFPDRHPLRILELNCGTGEDALFLAKLGHHVIATDISGAMINLCNDKIAAANLRSHVSTQVLDMKDLSSTQFNQPFDLIFSNFGGLNCLSHGDIQTLSHDMSKLLKPHGRFIGIFMPNFSIVESVYFIFKLNFKKIFRRNSKTYCLVNVNGVEVKTWYYQPALLRELISSEFTISEIRSIGFLPSYLEGVFRRHKLLGQLAHQIGRILVKLNWTAVADHYLVDTIKKTDDQTT